MMAESIQIAAESVGNKVDFHKTDVLPPRPVKVPTSIFTTSWVHRYFNLGQELDNETESKSKLSYLIIFFIKIYTHFVIENVLYLHIYFLYFEII